MEEDLTPIHLLLTFTLTSIIFGIFYFDINEALEKSYT